MGASQDEALGIDEHLISSREVLVSRPTRSNQDDISGCLARAGSECPLLPFIDTHAITQKHHCARTHFQAHASCRCTHNCIHSHHMHTHILFRWKPHTKILSNSNLVWDHIPHPLLSDSSSWVCMSLIKTLIHWLPCQGHSTDLTVQSVIRNSVW